MLIEYTKDAPHFRREGQIIPKGKKLRVTDEIGKSEIERKVAKDVTKKMDEFLKEIYKKQKDVEENGDN